MQTEPGHEPQQLVDSHGYHYIIVGNHLLTPVEVQRAMASAATPPAAVGALKRAYEAKGYFLVALAGTEHGKEVTLHVIEGRITQVAGPKPLAIFFTGLKGNNEIRESDVVRQSILAQAFAATNGLQPQVGFHPATEAGGSVLQITDAALAVSHPIGAEATVGNFGNRYAGHYLAQGQMSVQHDGMILQVNYSRALTGLDSNTHGAHYSAKSATFSKVTPVGIFGLDGSTTTYHLGEKFAPLYPGGKIKVFGGTTMQLLYADELRRWSVHEGVHRIHDTGTVFSGSFVLHDRKFDVLDVGSDFSWRFGGLFHRTATVSVSGGIKLGFANSKSGFTNAQGSPASHFKIYDANIDATQSLAGGYSLKFSIGGQATPHTLPSYEQWVLGGVNNLSAWLPGTIVGDRGYLGRFVTQGPQWQLGPLRLRPSGFVEYGASRFSYIAPQAPVWQVLGDVGVSLDIGLKGAMKTSGILAYAKPVDSRNVTTTQRRGQRGHVFFFLQTSF